MKENGSKVKVRLLLFLAGLIVMFAATAVQVIRWQDGLSFSPELIALTPAGMMLSIAGLLIFQNGRKPRSPLT